MSYLKRATVAEGVVDGLTIIIKEGLNYAEKLELRIEVPKALWGLYNDVSEAFIYERKGPMFFGHNKLTGVVRFYYYDAPGHGYGGSVFELPMKDGTTQTLIGPWSSNSETMNKAGFEPSKEVNIDAMYNLASCLTHERINKLIGPLGYHCNSLNRIVPIH